MYCRACLQASLEKREAVLAAAEAKAAMLAEMAEDERRRADDAQVRRRATPLYTL